MARVNMHRQVLIFQYLGHKFYMDALNQGEPLTHIDPRGREIQSECLDEDDAMQYVDSLARRVNENC